MKRTKKSAIKIDQDLILDFLDWCGGQVSWSEVLDFNKVRNLGLTQEQLRRLFSQSNFNHNQN